MMNTETVGEYDGCVNYLAIATIFMRCPRSGSQHGAAGSGQGANVLLTDNHKWGATVRGVARHDIECRNPRRVRTRPKRHGATPDVQRFKMVNKGFVHQFGGLQHGRLWGIVVSVHLGTICAPRFVCILTSCMDNGHI